MSSAILLSIAFLSLQSIFGELGPLSEEVVSLGGMLSIFLLGIDRALKTRLKSLQVLVILLSGVGMLVAPGMIFQAMFMGSAIYAYCGKKGQPIGSLILFVAFVKFHSLQVPALADLESVISSLIFDGSVAASFEPSAVGPTAVGLHTILFSLLLVAIFHRDLGSKWWVYSCVQIFCVLVLPFWLAGVTADGFGVHQGHGHAVKPFDNLTPLAAVIFVLNYALLLKAKVAPFTQLGQKSWEGPSVPRVLFGVALSAVFLLSFSGWAWQKSPQKRMVVLDEGGFDWDVPRVEAPGVYNNGMFGLLPHYLESAGWDFELAQASNLDEAIAGAPGILTVINNPHVWTVRERDLITQFVDSGGCLLVLGDHTNVFDSQIGLNSLIEEWGIKFRFDSAYHIENSWRRCLAWVDGYLPPKWKSADPGIAVGASLEVNWPAFPVIMGPYAFSDHGVAENAVGAFLGNYSFDQGEELGDLNLVAGRFLGKGRILVFGDTSSFQNGGLSKTFAQFVLPLLNSQARPGHFSFEGLHLLRILGTLLFLVLFVALIMGFLQVGEEWVVLYLALAIFCLLQSSPSSQKLFEEIDLSESLIIPEATMPNIGHYSARWNTIQPLISAANRAGQTVFRVRDWVPSVFERSKGIAIVAPTRVSSSMREDVNSFVNAGVNLLVVGAAEESRGVNALLASFGMTVTGEALGTVPRSKSQDPLRPRFVNPSPIRFVDGQVEPLFSYGKSCFGAVRQDGNANIVLISDSRFFSSRNSEGTWGYWTGNLRFAHGVFTEFLGGRPAGFPMLSSDSKNNE